MVAEDVLAFAGIATPTLRLYPIETHIAEKLHAYTMPRTRPNARVKDLPDIALLATAQPIDAKRLRAALEQTFAFRKTHALPANMPEPPIAWSTPYVAMACEDQRRAACPDVPEYAHRSRRIVMAGHRHACRCLPGRPKGI